MKHYLLTKDQIAANNGYTDLVVITADDLTETTDDLLQDIQILTLDAGDIVYADALAEVVTPFTPDPSANATVTVSVGRTATGYTDILGASNLINAGTQIAAKVTYLSATALEEQKILSDSTAVFAQIDINDADGDLATITAGEVNIWLKISRWANRAAIQK